MTASFGNKQSKEIKINVGCGDTPTEDYINYDNSFSQYISVLPLEIIRLMKAFKIIGHENYNYIKFIKIHNIQFGNSLYLPLGDNAVDVLYSSHMFEHLDRIESATFLKESLRVLKPGGILRLVLPDLNKITVRYLRKGNSDDFMNRLGICERRPRGVIEKMKYLIIGSRKHMWMYDAKTLSEYLRKNGFSKMRVLPPNSTLIKNPGKLNLSERKGNSFYIEAIKPLY